MKFVPLNQAEQQVNEGGEQPLRFVPLQKEAPAPAASVLAPPAKPTKPVKGETAEDVMPEEVDIADLARPREAKGFHPGQELTKGIKAGLVGLKSMPTTFGMAGISDVLVSAQKNNDILDRIDAGQITSAREARQMSGNDPRVGMYFASDAATRQKIRQSFTNDLLKNKQLLAASMNAFQQYQRESKQYKGRTEDVTSVRSPTDFGNWLAKSLGEGGVQLAPLMVAALVAKSPGVFALGSSMEVAGGVQNRMEFLGKELQKLSPEERVNRVAQYLNETNDTTVAAGLLSGSLDVLLGPAAKAAKLTAKNFLQYSTRKGAVKAAAKELPKDVGEEFLTGAGQEAIQIGAEKVLGEQQDVATLANLKRVINAAAKEAAGAPVGTAVNVGRAALATPALQGVEFPAPPAQEAQRVEPTMGEGPLQAPPSQPSVNVEPLGEAEPPAPPTTSAPPPLAAQEQALFEAERDGLISRGVPEDSADRIAKRRVAAARKQRIRDLIAQPTEDEIQNRAKELIDSGMDPALAIDEAAKQITAEREADAYAASEQAGVGDTTATVPGATGEGVGVAGQPAADTAAPGVGVSEPEAVVPTGQTPAADVGGEGAQPGAVEGKFNPFIFAQQSADSAFADAGSFASEQDAIASYRENVVDTLREQGRDHPRTVEMALEIYDDAINARTASAPTEPATTEPTDGTQTPETQQAEAQGPEAPAAGAPAGVEAPAPKKRRVAAEGKKLGRPVTLTPEQKAENAEAKKAIQAHKARAERAITNAKTVLDALSKMDTIEVDALGVDGRAALRNKKREAIATLLDLQDDPYIRGTAVGKRVKEALTHPSITKQELADLKKGLEAKKAAEQTSRSSAGGAPADSRFNKFTNGAQALSHIIKTGNAFQKMLGKRLRAFVSDVKFAVIEQGDALPAQLQTARNNREWNRARALYIENGITGEKTVYVRGESFGAESQGVNNVTVLHELLHAATNRKVALAVDAISRGVSLNDPLVRAAQDLLRTMRSAVDTYNAMAKAGKVSRRLAAIARGQEGAALTDPREFIAYGMSDEDFQNFLMQTRGYEEDTTFFNRFVRGVRKLFGMEEGVANALSDLILVTDTILRSKAPAKGVFKGSVSASVIPENEDEFGNPIRTPQEMKVASEKARFATETSRAFEESRRADKVLPALRQLVARGWMGMNETAIKRLVEQPTFTFLADWSGIQSLKDAEKNVQLLNGMATSLLTGAHKVIVPLEKALNPFFFAGRKAGLRTKLENLIYETTTARYDPSDPNKKETDFRLDKMYQDIGPEGRKLYKMVKDYYSDLIDLYSDLLDQQIENLRGVSPEVKNNLMLTLRRTFEAEMRIRPYFPLVRHGDYWARVEVDKEPVFLMFDNAADRESALREFAKERGENYEELRDAKKITLGEGQRELRFRTQGQSAMLTQIFEALDKEAFDSPEAKEALKDSIYQIYLATMPEQSFRNQFVHRKDRIGFSTDLIRNMSSSASKMSIQLARLKYAPILRNNIDAAADVAEDKDNLRPFVAEARKRVESVLKGPTDDAFDAVAGLANKVSFTMYLSGASSALVQPFSLYITALPVIGANSGNMPGAAKELMKAVGDIRNYGVTTTNADGSVSLAAPSLANSTRLSTDERRAVKAMEDRGLAKNTYANLVWARQGVSTDYASTTLGKVGKLGKEAGNLVVGALMHNVERLTREATFLASYRLNRRKFDKEGMTPEEAHLSAVDQAASDVNEALADYDVSNRPRWMQKGIGRIVGQFKMFPVHTMLLLGTNFVRMLPMLNKEGKAAAAKKFFGILMTTGSIAGMQGLPLFGSLAAAIAWLVSQAAGDDEDETTRELRETDPVTWFRNVFLPEHLGDIKVGDKRLSELVDTGPVNALTGSAIAERIGLADLLGRDTKEAKTARDGLVLFMLDHLGPLPSTALSFADAYEAASIGDYQKMVEKITPAILRNNVIADKLKTEGIKDAKGQVVLGPEEITAWKLFMQRIGFRPAEVARMSETSFRLTSAEQRIMNEQAKLLARIKVQARKETDEGDAAMEKIIEEEVGAFNSKHPGFGIDGDTIVKALLADAEKRGSSRYGVTVTEHNAALVEKALDEVERRIEREKKPAK